MRLFSALCASFLLIAGQINAQQADSNSFFCGYNGWAAQFPGDSLASFLSHNLKYPDALREAGVEGRVYIQATIGADGTVSNAVVARSSFHTELDEEALRVVRLMPPWIPARKDGQPVPSTYHFPIVFRLD